MRGEREKGKEKGRRQEKKKGKKSWSQLSLMGNSSIIKIRKNCESSEVVCLTFSAEED